MPPRAGSQHGGGQDLREEHPQAWDMLPGEGDAAQLVLGSGGGGAGSVREEPLQIGLAAAGRGRGYLLTHGQRAGWGRWV